MNTARIRASNGHTFEAFYFDLRNMTVEKGFYKSTRFATERLSEIAVKLLLGKILISVYVNRKTYVEIGPDVYLLKSLHPDIQHPGVYDAELIEYRKPLPNPPPAKGRLRYRKVGGKFEVTRGRKAPALGHVERTAKGYYAQRSRGPAATFDTMRDAVQWIGGAPWQNMKTAGRKLLSLG